MGQAKLDEANAKTKYTTSIISIRYYGLDSSREYEVLALKLFLKVKIYPIAE